MTMITGSLSVSQLTPMRIASSQTVHVSDLPERHFQDYLQRTQSFLEARHSHLQPGDARLNETYAEVIVNGRVVATLDNNGYLQTSNGFLNQLGVEHGSGSLNPPNIPKGPALAQARADYLSQLTGGTVLVHITALDQATYEGLEQPKVIVNHQALNQAPFNLNLLQIQQARQEFLQRQTDNSQPSLLDS